MKQIIERTEYLNKLIAFKDKDLIKIITGIRRCGKSTLMKIFQNYLLQHGVKEKQIIKINFEDFAFRNLLDAEALHKYIMENIIPEKMNYVFLDEIQNVKEFPAVINSLNLQLVTHTGDMQTEVTGGYASDLLSNVMGQAEPGMVWVTMQGHKNVAAVASLIGLAAVIVAGGAPVEEDTLKKADANNINIAVTSLPAYVVAGQLYALGITNGK